MLSLATTSKLGPEEVIRRAVAYFGKGGLGLEVKEQTEVSASFQGGGGGVGLTANREGKETSVELLSQEWDVQIKEFIRNIR
ncbi:MAG: hypothetical protein ABID71_01225 [Chloroflexota bacterium]